MKKALIGLTLALLLITFVKGSQGFEVELSVVSELNAAVDSTLQTRLQHLSAQSRPECSDAALADVAGF